MTKSALTNHDLSLSTTTRKQLQIIGASPYHAVRLTQSLKPLYRKGRTYLYAMDDVIRSIQQYLNRPRLKQTTHSKLQKVLNTLTSDQDNVIFAGFGHATDAKLSQLTQQLFQGMSQTDKQLRELKLEVETIKASYSISGDVS